MTYTWFVTFELHKRGTLLKQRSPRATKTFETEKEAREFARVKFNDGLTVYAGTINPHKPRRTIPLSDFPAWLDDEREQQDQDSAQASDRKEPG
jgi:hypothetical protein